MSPIPRALMLFDHDWDAISHARAAAEANAGQGMALDHSGFDLFSFPSNVRLVWFDTARGVDALARRARHRALAGGDLAPRAIWRSGCCAAGRAHGLARHAGQRHLGLSAQVLRAPGVGAGGARGQSGLCADGCRVRRACAAQHCLPAFRPAGEGGVFGAGAAG